MTSQPLGGEDCHRLQEQLEPGTGPRSGRCLSPLSVLLCFSASFLLPEAASFHCYLPSSRNPHLAAPTTREALAGLWGSSWEIKQQPGEGFGVSLFRPEAHLWCLQPKSRGYHDMTDPVRSHNDMIESWTH